MVTMSCLSATSRLRRLFAIGAITASNIHKCMHGLEQSVYLSTEYKRHGNLFDCYSDAEDTDTEEEEWSGPSTPSFSSARVIPIETEELTPSEPPIMDKDTKVEDSVEEEPIESQFGPIGSQMHRYVSQHMGGPLREHIADEPSYFYLLTTYISYMILTTFGHVRDFFGKRFKPDKYKDYKDRDGYAALNSDYDNFYFRRLKKRMDDCFSRPYETISLLNSPTDLLQNYRCSRPIYNAHGSNLLRLLDNV